MLYFFDAHIHIGNSRYYRGNLPDKLLERARKVGVRAVLVAAVNRADWPILEDFITDSHVIIAYALGIHPYAVPEITPNELWDHLDELRMRVARHPRGLRAIGETGLDFHRARDLETRQHQSLVFRAHLELSRATGLPLTLHCVGAHGPLLDLLLERPTPASMLHAFSGSPEVAARLVRAGHFVSFAGNLCRANARKVLDSARAVPSGSLLIETDSPDQTPELRRPRTNEPAFVVDVARRLAAVRGESLDWVADTTRANACRLFEIDERTLMCEFPDDLGGDVDRLLAEST